MLRQLSFALALLACGTMIGATDVFAGPSELTQLAQAQTDPSQPAAPATPASDATAPAADAQAPEEPIGNVATVTGSASVIRNDKTTPLKVKDDIYLNDVVQTGANSTLGITFIDATTFNLKASTKITIDNYVYEDGGKSNAAIFDVAKGTAAFVAASVAKTGDMKITTPTATLGIRGTTGLVEVPEGAAANNPNNVAVKLYPDADGRVGRIEVNDRAGARLGFLTQGASGFTIRPGAGGARFAAVPLVIPQAVMLRDQGFVRQLHSTQNVGRQLVFQQREFRRANPGFVNPNRPIRQFAARPAAAEWFAGTEQAWTTAAAWSVKSSRPAAAERLCPGNPVSRHCRLCRTARGSSNPASSIVPGNRNNRARHRAPDSSNRARPINPACRRGPDNRDDPVCRHSPDCRRARDNRHGPICRRSPACRRARDNRNSRPCRRSPPRRRHGRDCRTGSACPDCSACPAFRERPPYNVRDCPPRRGGPRPRRNAASRRQRISVSRKMASGIAPQPIAQLLYEASRLPSRSSSPPCRRPPALSPAQMTAGRPAALHQRLDQRTYRRPHRSRQAHRHAARPPARVGSGSGTTQARE